MGADRRAKRVREETWLDSPAQEDPDQVLKLVSVKDQDVGILLNSCPMTFAQAPCLICFGKGSIRRLKRKDSLRKHIDRHKTEGTFEQSFPCGKPSRSERIEGEGHFKSHAAVTHGV